MFKLFKNFTKRDGMLILAALVFIVAQVWLDLELPDYMSEITVLVQTEGSEMGEIISAGAKMLACAFGSLICSVIASVFSAKLGIGFAATVSQGAGFFDGRDWKILNCQPDYKNNK